MPRSSELTKGNASLRLGGSTGSTDIPHRGDHGRACKVYRHGHDLEYPRWRRREPMCDHCHPQLDLADYSVLAICCLVHQCHFGGAEYRVTIWQDCHRCFGCEYSFQTGLIYSMLISVSRYTPCTWTAHSWDPAPYTRTQAIRHLPQLLLPTRTPRSTLHHHSHLRTTSPADPR